jgi:N-acetylglucosamine PTS system EIICBA or EIICB component
MNRFGAFQGGLQVLGRALMLPIAILPVAALMLRLGQPDLLNQPFIAVAGSAIFAQIGLLFAIGVGVGIAKESHGAAGLAGAVAYLVLIQGAKIFIDVPPDLQLPTSDDPAFRDAVVNAWRERQLSKLSVPAGIISGLAAGILYNRFHAIRLPEYLSFFGGRRFVPIAAGLFGLLAAAAFGIGFPILGGAIDTLSTHVTASGSAGLFVYGLLNRLLLVTGLHHILNNLAWFVVGDFQGTAGDLNRFFAGDPDAGAFMAGFFPVMMFGLPGACLAMWRSVRPERRKAMAGMYLSMALTSFLTGVTEPIEFTFMFVAPALFLIHAVLTGCSMVIMDWLNVRLGFGFSAGLFDYLLNFSLGTNALLMLPVGAAYFLIYYTVFRVSIRRFGLAVPGAEAAASLDAENAPASEGAARSASAAAAYADALGGVSNLASVEACTTRLRLVLHDATRLDADKLRAVGAKGIVKSGPNAVQVVIGPDADRLAGEIRAFAGSTGSPALPVERAMAAAMPGSLAPEFSGEMLGGQTNITAISRCGARLIVHVADRAAVRPDLLDTHYCGRWLETSGGAFHLILN